MAPELSDLARELGATGGLFTDLREGLGSDDLVDGRYRVVGRIGSGGMADVYCAEDTHGTAEGLISGAVPLDEGEAFFDATNAREHVSVPLLGERRMLVLGEGIVGPDPDLENWTAGISTVASWRKP